MYLCPANNTNYVPFLFKDPIFEGFFLSQIHFAGIDLIVATCLVFAGTRVPV